VLKSTFHKNFNIDGLVRFLLFAFFVYFSFNLVLMHAIVFIQAKIVFRCLVRCKGAQSVISKRPIRKVFPSVLNGIHCMIDFKLFVKFLS